MAVNRKQLSSDWRSVDVSSVDYASETGEPFIVRVGVGGTIGLHNFNTDEII